MDDKASLMGILEAAESLIARGFEPQRTVLFSFGHDEEIGGLDGARSVAALLESSCTMRSTVDCSHTLST